VRYLYIKRNVEKVWGARYTLGARYLSKNTVLRTCVPLTKVKTNKKDSFYYQLEQTFKELHKYRTQTSSCDLNAQGCGEDIFKPKILNHY
jgi:hypothetical protein